MKRISFAFILLMCCLCGTNAQRYDKMSAMLRHEVMRTAQKTTRAATHSSYVTALVRCTDSDVFHDNDCKVLATFHNDIYIVAIPLHRLSALSEHDSVERIEAGASCSLHNDTTAQLVQTDRVWQYQREGNTLGYTGRGVVVGVQDIGFDLTHPTFRDAEGKHLRIRRFWDMLDPENSYYLNPLDPQKEGFYIGKEFTTEEEILNKAHATDGLIVTHGTHTAGTAAGNGAPFLNSPLSTFNTTLYSLHSTLKQGHAPEADIVLVANFTSDDSQLVSEEERQKFTTATDLLGFKYILDYAESVGKPCVINFSEGTHSDFDEFLLYDEVLTQLTGPGRIIVGSAGNEAMKLSHLDKPRGRSSARSLYYSQNSYGMVVFRTDGDVNIRITLDALGAEPLDYVVRQDNKELDSLYADTVTVGGTDYVVSYGIYHNCYDPEHLAGDLLIQDLKHEALGSSASRVLFTLEGEESHQELFYYIGQFLSRDELKSDADNTHSVLFPGSSPSVICVGATGYRPGVVNVNGEWMASEPEGHGTRSRMSSIGPALSGISKPDIMAPGVNIISSYSSYYIENNPDASDVKWDVEHFDYNGRTYAWNSNTGTSMSAPAVTGIIALWLEACPTLTVEQIHEVFQNTARPMNEPYDFVGYGEINALAGLEYILENYVTGIKKVEDHPSDSKGLIFDLYGRRVDAKHLSRGVYVVKGRGVRVF